jgi:hypothetical protein
MKAKPRVAGNQDVIDLLETYLVTARENDFGHIAICMVGHPNVAAIDYTGEISLELSQLEALGILRSKIDQSIANWTPPPRDESLDPSFVCYNLANGPLGFDFLVWLIDQEMTRIRVGAPHPLKVGFWLGHDAATRMRQDHRGMWLDRVFRPALTLLGAVEDPRAIGGHRSEVFVTRNIVARSRAGEPVPRFSSGHALTHGRYVTITLRESSHWQHRNSKIDDWIRFARDLRQEGRRVIFVRDTERADMPIKGFEIAPYASRDLIARAILYEGSDCNFFVSNGPVTLAVFGDRPWLQFVPIEPDGSGYTPNTGKFWRESAGIGPGEQYPWSAPSQRMVWAPDTYDNIKQAWSSLL